MGIALVPSILGCATVVVTPPEPRRRPSPRGVFPFRFAGQSIGAVTGGREKLAPPIGLRTGDVRPIVPLKLRGPYIPFTMANNASPVGRPAVFMHIQKTAGTSITEAVRPHYQNDIVSHGDYLKYDTASLKNIRFISGHFGFEYARQFMDGRYSFTFLRDPVERILSLYYFSRTRDPAEFPIYRVAHEMDLADYLRAGLDRKDVNTYLWNLQAWQLACGWDDPLQREPPNFTAEQILERAKVHLMEFHYIGFVESIAVDSKVILANLHVPVPKSLVPANLTPERPHRNDLPAATIRLAEELTRLDTALYEHAKDLCRRGFWKGG